MAELRYIPFTTSVLSANEPGGFTLAEGDFTLAQGNLAIASGGLYFGATSADISLTKASDGLFLGGGGGVLTLNDSLRTPAIRCMADGTECLLTPHEVHWLSNVQFNLVAGSDGYELTSDLSYSSGIVFFTTIVS